MMNFGVTTATWSSPLQRGHRSAACPSEGACGGSLTSGGRFDRRLAIDEQKGYHITFGS
jgi:hypothetical protein